MPDLQGIVVTPKGAGIDWSYKGFSPYNAKLEFLELIQASELKNAVDRFRLAKSMDRSLLAKTTFEAASFPVSMINPVVGLSLGAAYGLHGIYDAKLNGLNWQNGTEIALASLPVGRNVARIGRNIANRNRFFYMYNPPLGYTDPMKRAKAVAKHILTDETPSIENLRPLYNVKDYFPEGVDSKILRFRDAAYRKYLGLPEKEPIYLPNGDGTFSYNLPYVEKMGYYYDLPLILEGVIPDWVTSNGGLVSSKVQNLGKAIREPKIFEVQRLEDIWDLLPFKATRLVDGKVTGFLRDIAGKVYDNNPLFLTKFGYNHLGGKWLNDFRYVGNPKWALKLENIEVGPIMGGKPFTMRTDVPLTKTISLETDPMIKYTVGHQSLDILPLGVFDWRANPKLIFENAYKR